ncbi:MAG: hypothetical protein JSV85_05510 [Candidatus Bathyarchaeota archaeon]|nr:MAG: hypothetical protein JSV85_05510 [Candidatus Bathyarchaeota archaeon]
MKKKIMATFAILMFALSVAGLVYAHWSDRVTIDITAEMGSLTFGFTRIVAEWDWEDYAAEKEVGNGVCELSLPVTDVHSGKTVYKRLTFTVTAAYPQYWAINKFTLDNAGTIPVKIQSVRLILPDGFWYMGDPDYPGALWHVYDDRNMSIYNIWLYKEPLDYGPGWEIQPPWEFPGPFGDIYGVRALKGNQIEPCNELLTEILVDPKQDAEECHTYNFHIEIEAIQWNKYTP